MKSKPARTTEAATETETGGDRTEYERFEELARKLVNVPKREIDQQRERKPA